LKKSHKALGFLLAANFEAVTVFLAAYYVGEWLNEQYQREFDWFFVTFLLGLLVIAHSWWNMFKTIKKEFMSGE
jgi:hypothetical protein